MFLIFQARSQWHEVATFMNEEVCMKGSFGFENITLCEIGKLENIHGTEMIQTLFFLVVVGPVIGYLVGQIAVFVVEFVYNDVIIETTMTVLAE